MRKAVRSGELGAEVCVHALEVESFDEAAVAIKGSDEKAIGAVVTAENCIESVGGGGATRGKAGDMDGIGIVCTALPNICMASGGNFL
jgi:hypothetical protein